MFIKPRRIWKETLNRTYISIMSKLSPPSVTIMKVVKCNCTLSNRPVWLNGWVFVYELSGCGFESRCSHLNFRYCASFEQRVPWQPGKYREWIHSETHTWHDNNIHWNKCSQIFDMSKISIKYFVFVLIPSKCQV